MRIGFFAAGAAGDVLPLAALASYAQVTGDQVVFATGRPMAHLLQALGLPTVVFGDGSELRATRDSRLLFPPKRNGHLAWSHYLDHYIAHELESSVDAIRHVIRRFKPDLLVGGTFVPAVGLVASIEGTPWTVAALLPELLSLADQGILDSEGFAPVLRTKLRSLASERSKGSMGSGELRNLIDPSNRVLLHDSAVLAAVGLERTNAVGFPGEPETRLGSGLPSDETDRHVRRSTAHSNRIPRPRVAITFGSLMSVSLAALIEDVAVECLAYDIDIHVIGPAAPMIEDDRYSAQGWGPLAAAFANADAVVHHGGLGTTFAALRSCRPAVVVPYTFDQAFNARAVEALASGVQTEPDPAAIVDALRGLLGSRGTANEMVPLTLTSQRDACTNALQQIRSMA